MRTTRSLAEALGRTNRLAVGAGQTPTRVLPSPLLHAYTRFLLASLSYLFRSRFIIISERISFSSERIAFAFPHSQNVSPHRTSLSLQNVPLSPFPLRTELPHAFSHSFFYPRAVSTGCRLPQAHPTPLGHGYHDDPCALKKRWASELMEDRC